MDTDTIMSWIFTLCISFALIASPIITGFNFYKKDIHKKELILNCNNDLACIELILGKDGRYGY